jgi:sialate O-acetylesterase
MIQRWRDLFKNQDLWFGFVQIANYRYSIPYGNPPRPETDHSHAAGDLRQAQLAALKLPKVGMTTSVDTGDWTNIHPVSMQLYSPLVSSHAPLPLLLSALTA